jgi:hypothetical protein
LHGTGKKLWQGCFGSSQQHLDLLIHNDLFRTQKEFRIKRLFFSFTHKKISPFSLSVISELNEKRAQCIKLEWPMMKNHPLLLELMSG